MGAPATPGGYPTLYALFNASSSAPRHLYEGQWNGTTVTWSLFGSTGTCGDLPPVQQVQGFQSIRGDFNTYRRLYVSSQQTGFAYYTP
jgi:hypothetical protein